MQTYLRLAIIALVVLLSGCNTAWRAIDSDRQSTLNLRHPDLLPGQKAYVNAGTYVAQYLRETNLFSSVETTNSTTPTSSGVYISIETLHRYERSSSTGLFGTLIFMFSLGLIPDPACHEYNISYATTIYQNGVLLTGSVSSIVRQEMCGWYTLSVDKNDVNRDEAKIVVNRLISSLNGKK